MSPTPQTCEITVGAAGPADAPRLRLRLVSTFHPEFIAALKAAIPSHDRAWRDPPACWWVDPRHQEALCALAAQYYPRASLVEGRQIIDLRTGQVLEQLDLFGDG